MNLELEKSKTKRKPHVGDRHPRIRGRYVEFDLDVMSPQEPTPSEGHGSRSEDQAELDEFQDATEGPSTNGGHACNGHEGEGNQKSRGQPKEKLTVETEHTGAESGEHQQVEEQDGHGRGRRGFPTRGLKTEEELEDEGNLDMGEHAEEQSKDGASDSEGGEGDHEDQWNAVCVACLRVYSRDPDLTITLLSPEDKRGMSNLVRGQEPAGATM